MGGIIETASCLVTFPVSEQTKCRSVAHCLDSWTAGRVAVLIELLVYCVPTACAVPA
jgi:hypothetical protein